MKGEGHEGRGWYMGAEKGVWGSGTHLSGKRQKMFDALTAVAAAVTAAEVDAEIKQEICASIRRFRH